MSITLITIVHVTACVLLIFIVLLQQGKGADAGAAFGGGSQTFFGASGADNLLTRVTTATAVIFMFTSVVLAYNGKHALNESGTIFQNIPAEEAPAEIVPETPQADSQEDVSPKEPDTTQVTTEATSESPSPVAEPSLGVESKTELVESASVSKSAQPTESVIDTTSDIAQQEEAQPQASQ